jgi:hypothetical protein
MFINIGHANINGGSRADACPRSGCQSMGAGPVDRNIALSGIIAR